jgi:hypothetical protein
MPKELGDLGRGGHGDFLKDRKSLKSGKSTEMIVFSH